jgi:hypothetical protein
VLLVSSSAASVGIVRAAGRNTAASVGIAQAAGRNITALFWARESTGTSAHRLRRTRQPCANSRPNCRMELATVKAAGAYAH